jgi:hypothetical protein
MTKLDSARFERAVRLAEERFVFRINIQAS